MLDLSRLLFSPSALSIVMLTSGCDTFSASFAQLFSLQPQTGAAPSRPAPPEAQIADRVLVLKSRRLLELQRGGKTIGTFPIALGSHPDGEKRRRGDGRTPEGIYHINSRKMNTRWTRELHISYPSEEQQVRARAEHVDPGGGIFIHAMPADYGPYDPPIWVRDWTDGCIAVGNAAIVKIWNAVPDGTPIEILP